MFSGIFIDLFGYKTLFPYGSIFVLLSLGTMMMVKHGDSKPIRKSALESYEDLD
ncbi:MAG: hypothetical protein GX928_00585 [Ruminococcaceae bacterium]|nr:hypothetical protein [Oscillospiraceae bacterium]